MTTSSDSSAFEKARALMNAKLNDRHLPAVISPRASVQPVLTGQIALVTGGDSGIGRGAVLALAEAGANVVLSYATHQEAAEEVVAEVKKLGRDAHTQACDVSKENEVHALFERAKKEFGTVDILVSNAGIQQDAPIDTMTLAQWQRVIDVNLTGQFLCAREAAREFKRRGVRPEISCAAGKIICMSSVHDVIPWAGHVNYASSKGGIAMMMKTLAQELAPFRIRVNSISPGAIRTPINKAAWNTAEAYTRLMDLVPYNRIGEAEDIGRAVAWLASDASDYVVGATLYIDGGMTLYPGFADGG
jgi:glucose 1-dehydrogenase